MLWSPAAPAAHGRPVTARRAPFPLVPTSPIPRVGTILVPAGLSAPCPAVPLSPGRPGPRALLRLRREMQSVRRRVTMRRLLLTPVAAASLPAPPAPAFHLAPLARLGPPLAALLSRVLPALLAPVPPRGPAALTLLARLAPLVRCRPRRSAKTRRMLLLLPPALPALHALPARLAPLPAARFSPASTPATRYPLARLLPVLPGPLASRASAPPRPSLVRRTRLMPSKTVQERNRSC